MCKHETCSSCGYRVTDKHSTLIGTRLLCVPCCYILTGKKEPFTYQALKKRFCDHEQDRPNHHLTAHIVFAEDSFDKPYSLQSRTYVVSSNNKAFLPGMGGYSIFAHCLDGTDPCVRLEHYMKEEHGGPDGWVVDFCYLVEDEHA